MIERVSVYMYTFSNCYNDVDYEIVDDIFGQSQVSTERAGRKHFFSQLHKSREMRLLLTNSVRTRENIYIIYTIYSLWLEPIKGKIEAILYARCKV